MLWGRASFKLCAFTLNGAPDMHVSMSPPPRLCLWGGSYLLRLICLTALHLFYPLVELVHRVLLDALFECCLEEEGVLLTLKVTVRIDSLGPPPGLGQQA